MIERCLIQILVEILTGQNSLEEILMTIHSVIEGKSLRSPSLIPSKMDEQCPSSDNLEQMVLRWVAELDKW